jgi:hypothetical protein
MMSLCFEPGHSRQTEVSTVRVSGWDKEASSAGYFELRVDPSADADGTDLVLCG